MIKSDNWETKISGPKLAISTDLVLIVCDLIKRGHLTEQEVMQSVEEGVKRSKEEWQADDK